MRSGGGGRRGGWRRAGGGDGRRRNDGGGVVGLDADEQLSRPLRCSMEAAVREVADGGAELGPVGILGRHLSCSPEFARIGGKSNQGFCFLNFHRRD